MSKVSFKTELFKIDSWTLLKLPKSASVKLPSRGMVATQGTINGLHFQTALEPDGEGSHWFKVDETVLKAADVATGDTVKLTLEPTEECPEPDLPVDLKKALAASPSANHLWQDITPLARWDWIRWIRSAKQEKTRQKRIATACSMLGDGKRRPCCFDRNRCTEPSISKNGVLIKHR